MEVGDIVRKYGTSYRLKSYIADFNYNSDYHHTRVITYDRNRDKLFEYWICERTDGIEIVLGIQKVFEKVNNEIRDHCDLDRPKGQFIDDKWEVNLLLDSYEEYINNQRDLEIKNPMLVKRRKELSDLIDFLGYHAGKKGKSRRSVDKNPLRIGFKILYVHRISPSWCGHQVFKKWCRDYPREHLKMQEIINNWLKSKKSNV
jgi:hypothetical protein